MFWKISFGNGTFQNGIFVKSHCISTSLNFKSWIKLTCVKNEFNPTCKVQNMGNGAFQNASFWIPPFQMRVVLGTVVFFTLQMKAKQHKKIWCSCELILGTFCRLRSLACFRKTSLLRQKALFVTKRSQSVRKISGILLPKCLLTQWSAGAHH